MEGIDEKPNPDIFGDSGELNSAPNEILPGSMEQPYVVEQEAHNFYNDQPQMQQQAFNNGNNEFQNNNEPANPDLFGISVDYPGDQENSGNQPQYDDSSPNNQLISQKQPYQEVGANYQPQQQQPYQEVNLNEANQPEKVQDISSQQQYQTQYQGQQYFPQKKKSQAKIKHQQQQPQQQKSNSWFDILTFGLCSTKSASAATADISPPKEEKKLTPYEKVNQKYQDKFQVLTPAEQKEQQKQIQKDKQTKEEMESKYTKKFEDQMKIKDVEEEQARKKLEKEQRRAAKAAKQNP